MATPALEVNQMLTRVRIDVAAATEKKQVPWVNSSLLGEVFLSREQLPTSRDSPVLRAFRHRCADGFFV
jgi:uncharacterized caspase-like protein